MHGILPLVALQLRESDVYLSATTRIIVGGEREGSRRRGKSNTKERGEGMARRLKDEWEREQEAGGNS